MWSLGLLIHTHTTNSTKFFQKYQIEQFENAKKQYDSEYLEKCRLYYLERCKKEYLETTTPEERYQLRKKAWMFHDTSAFRLRGESVTPGCSPHTGCVPECRYYPEEGRIEDAEVESWYDSNNIEILP